ncbi:hypothetical protein VTN77DRAFT_1120 [Rasamsonia byssochlamydoides]|uniref:uncharacterized protein n=1 Tax=Rasamsonia byssochlamydoides TaxID=89139 RepID=UPI0037445712
MSGRKQSNRESLDGSVQSQPEMRQQDGLWSHPSLSRRSTNPNVFSDDYSVEPLDTPDANRPRRSLSISSNDSSSTLRQTQADQNAARSSRAENEATANPFADEARSSLDELQRRSSIRKGDLHNRQSSVTSTSTMSNRSGMHRPLSMSIPRAMSPYTGATGPSHPYAMYPQVGVSRSASIATMSTVQQADGPLQGTSAPQHPYAMYPQNIALEGVDDQPIPVGFPAGSLQPYQRAPAQPDDVGDIIGPDGHLEQLPPYSRYPDGIPPKTAMGAASIASAIPEQDQAAHIQPPPPPPPPPDMSSRTLVNINSTEPIARSEVSADSGTTSTQFDEKLGRRSRQSCCGAPCWLVALLVLGMLVGGLIGGVIGGILGERRAEERSLRRARESASLTPSVVTVTYTSDVTPLPTTPSNLLELPTGRFVVPASIQNQSKFCVSNTPYTASWSCQDQGFLNIEILGSNSQASILIPTPVIDGTFTYGAQAPFLPTPTQELHMMLDKDDPDFGPALFFTSPFNKLVIVQEDAFPTPSAQKRSINELELLASQWRREQVAQSGDKPWFCWWNSTAMEFFIYVNDTSSGGPRTSTPPVTAPPTTTTAGGGPASMGSTQTTPHSKRQTQASPASYPRRIKIEEKRAIPNAPQPYCTQMQVLGDGMVVPLPNNPIVIETIQPSATPSSGSSSGSSQKRESNVLWARDDDGYDNNCYCEWLWG